MESQGAGSTVTAGWPVLPIVTSLRTYKRATYDALRDMIVSFDLPPGERLVEKDLAVRLGVSKTPVREALAMLDSDGLVETTPYRGAIVRWLSRNEMAEQGFLVDALEMPAYEIVVERITDDELAVIDGVAEELVRARQDRDERAYGELNVRIHLLLFACTGFPRLLELIRVVVGPVGLRYDKALVYPFDESWDALVAIALARIEAIRGRDAAIVRKAVARHRRRLEALNEVNLADPSVSRYFRD